MFYALRAAPFWPVVHDERHGEVPHMQSPKAAELLSSLDQELHGLAQPISCLQCRLELGKILDTESALREAVDGGLEDLSRLMLIFTRMRALVAEALKGRT